jgi:hypothetical protein
MCSGDRSERERGASQDNPPRQRRARPPPPPTTNSLLDPIVASPEEEPTTAATEERRSWPITDEERADGEETLQISMRSPAWRSAVASDLARSPTAIIDLAPPLPPRLLAATTSPCPLPLLTSQSKRRGRRRVARGRREMVGGRRRPLSFAMMREMNRRLTVRAAARQEGRGMVSQVGEGVGCLIP